MWVWLLGCFVRRGLFVTLPIWSVSFILTSQLHIWEKTGDKSYDFLYLLSFWSSLLDPLSYHYFSYKGCFVSCAFCSSQSLDWAVVICLLLGHSILWFFTSFNSCWNFPLVSLLSAWRTLLCHLPFPWFLQLTSRACSTCRGQLASYACLVYRSKQHILEKLSQLHSDTELRKITRGSVSGLFYCFPENLVSSWKIQYAWGGQELFFSA